MVAHYLLYDDRFGFSLRNHISCTRINERRSQRNKTNQPQITPQISFTDAFCYSFSGCLFCGFMVIAIMAFPEWIGTREI